MSLGVKTRVSHTSPVVISDDPSHPEVVDQPELERRCTQALLAMMPELRQLINREREAGTYPITVQQYAVLKALQSQERLISELADLLKVSRPTMSRIIDGLEGRRRSPESEVRPKLVERVASQEDHRLVYARITEEGYAVLKNYHGLVENRLTDLLHQLNSSELPILMHNLEALVGLLQTRS